MNALNVALLMNHKSGISDNYWRPKEKEVLQDYLKAVEFLTINDRQATLQKQVTELKQKGEEQNYIIKGKLAEREKEIEEIKERQRREEEKLATLAGRLADISERAGLVLAPLVDDPDGEEAKELRQLIAREKKKRENQENLLK